MTAVTTGMTPDVFRGRLLEAGILRQTGVDGLYQRSGRFERIARAIERLASAAGDGGYEELRYFAPIMPRDTFLKTDYLKSFPDLIGSVDVFTGGDSEHAALVAMADDGGEWTEALTPAEVTLCSAACHPLYADLTGRLPEGGRRIEVQGFCFRHEPSLDPVRMQSFRQHEFVYIGDPAGAVSHRDAWLARGLDLLRSLGLEVEQVVANDPFFGRAGRMLVANQRETALKFEIVCPVSSDESPTAISSANYHLDHFGLPFAIETADGEVAHTACIGFGLERITLALLARHGFEPDRWPAATRQLLWP